MVRDNDRLTVGGFNELSTIDSEGVGFAIFFQGCSIRCPNCHNPELQEFDGGTIIQVSDILAKIKANVDWYDSVILLGGEPLDQGILPLCLLMQEVRKMGLEVWLYTGYEEHQIPSLVKSRCDVIVAGAYREDLKTGGFPASSNQKFIDNRN